MRKPRVRVPAIFLLAFALLLGGSMSVNAEWLLNGGYTGHIESGNVFPWFGSYYNQGMMTFFIESGESGAVNFPVPTRNVVGGALGVQQIKYRANVSHGVITAVTVYDGETLVQKFTGYWTGAWTTRVLNLSAKRVFTKGLQLVFTVKNSSRDEVGVFFFSSVGADFK